MHDQLTKSSFRISLKSLKDKNYHDRLKDDNKTILIMASLITILLISIILPLQL
jgi:hypothetical protein